mgnify:CR=1 FL=1
MDSLTGLNDKQYLLRRMNELTDAHKAFHIITVYAYQLDHMNKVSGVQSGDEFLRRAAEHMQEIAGRNVFRVTGKRFLLLTFSLREYEACLTSLRQVFRTQPDDAQAAPSPVILCGVVGAEKLGTGGLVLDYAEYLESLAARRGGTESSRTTARTGTVFTTTSRSSSSCIARSTRICSRSTISRSIRCISSALSPLSAQPPAASHTRLDFTGYFYPPCGEESPYQSDHRASAAARLPFSTRKPGAPREHCERQDQSFAARSYSQRWRKPPDPHSG